MKIIIEIWKNELNNKKFKLNVLLTFFVLAFVLFLVTHFLAYNESRIGFSFQDPILALFEPIDVTWFTFFIMYSAIPLAIISLIKLPKQLLLGFQIYIVMISFRVLSMYLLPLNPPGTIITLEDPFIAFFSTGMTFSKDLFFSGHTATMFLMFLVLKKGIIKTTFLIFTIAIAVLVLVQHVHYTIDVFVAPFVSYSSFKIAQKYNNLFL